MNHRTAKLLRHTIDNIDVPDNQRPQHLKALKRLWNATPWNQRNRLRKELEAGDVVVDAGTETSRDGNATDSKEQV